MNETTKPSTPRRARARRWPGCSPWSRRGGHHEAVAAHLAQLLAGDRVGQLRDTPVLTSVEGDVVDGELRTPLGARHASAGSSITSISPAKARSTPSSSSHGSTVARNPIAPKLTANTGTEVPANSRRADRIVPSPPRTSARSGGPSSPLVSTAPSGRGEAVLLRLLRRDAHLDPRPVSELEHTTQRTPVSPVRVWPRGRPCAGRSRPVFEQRPPGRRRRRARPPPRARRSSRGSPPDRAGRSSCSRAPRRLAARGRARRPDERGPPFLGARTTPPFPTRSRPTSN